MESRYPDYERVDIIELIETRTNFLHHLVQRKSRKVRAVNVALGEQKKRENPPGPTAVSQSPRPPLPPRPPALPPTLRARRENSRAISICRGSVEHINKKSFPACTRVTAHATSLQPLQPIFPALTSREAGRESGDCTRSGVCGGIAEEQRWTGANTSEFREKRRGRCERGGGEGREEERREKEGEKERKRDEPEG